MERRLRPACRLCLVMLDNPFASANGLVPPAALSIISPDFKPAHTQHWNLNIQREVERAGVFTIAYAGSKGTDLPRSLDANQPFPGLGAVSSRAPYPAFSNILETESGGNSEYQSLQFSFKRQLSRRASRCSPLIRFRNRLTIHRHSCPLRRTRTFPRTAMITGLSGRCPVTMFRTSQPWRSSTASRALCDGLAVLN